MNSEIYRKFETEPPTMAETIISHTFLATVLRLMNRIKKIKSRVFNYLYFCAFAGIGKLHYIE